MCCSTLRLGLVLVCLTGCLAAPAPIPERMPLSGLDFQPDIPVSRAPFDDVSVNWKQRMARPYAFVEARGSYTGIGALLEQVTRLAREQDLPVDGPPFALYYDDPGRVPVSELRMRACLPLREPASSRGPLAEDLLPEATVVYAFVAGPYPEVPRSYPGLFAYMDELGWREAGPVREVYLVNPASVADYADLVTEVQVAATSAR